MKGTTTLLLGALITSAVAISLPLSVKAGSNASNADYFAGYQTAFLNYSGYLDECKGWGGSKTFVNQDYDGDKKIDRVKRSYNELDSTAIYTIEFGNKNSISSDNYTEWDIPFVEGVDITGDNSNEIIFETLALSSTDFTGIPAGLEIYTKDKAGSYIEIVIDNRDISVCVEPDGKNSFSVSSFYPKFTQKVKVEKGEWDDNSAFNLNDTIATRCCAWDYAIEKNGRKNVIKFYYQLFDKWLPYGMVVTMKYEKGILHADEAVKVVVDNKNYDRVNPNYNY